MGAQQGAKSAQTQKLAFDGALARRNQGLLSVFARPGMHSYCCLGSTATSVHGVSQVQVCCYRIHLACGMTGLWYHVAVHLLAILRLLARFGKRYGEPGVMAMSAQKDIHEAHRSLAI